MLNNLLKETQSAYVANYFVVEREIIHFHVSGLVLPSIIPIHYCLLKSPLDVSEAFVLQTLADGEFSNVAIRVPQLTVEAKFGDILRYCNEQIIAELLVSGWYVNY